MREVCSVVGARGGRSALRPAVACVYVCVRASVCARAHTYTRGSRAGPRATGQPCPGEGAC